MFVTPRFHRPLLLHPLSLAIAVGLVVVCQSLAFADPGDEICFPLYRKAGAIPGTGITCDLTASTANVGLGNFFCTAEPDRIERYCGTLAVPNSCGKGTSPDVGHPIDTSNGNKHLTERDFTGSGLFPLVFERYYNSSPFHVQDGALGKTWRSNWDRVIQRNNKVARAIRPDGTIFYYALIGTKWVTKADITDSLVEINDATGRTSGWKLHSAEDDIDEAYDAKGKLLSVSARNGQKHTVTLSAISTPRAIAPAPGYPIQVADTFGRTLTFTWDSSGRLSTMKDAVGTVYTYEYDASSRLTKVTFADGADTPGARLERIFLYNEQTLTDNTILPNALTGIVDENGTRFASYSYDASGAAVQTSYASGVDQYAVSYNGTQSTVTDPRGSDRIYTFAKVLGAPRLTGISQPGGAGCSASSSKITYDGNGNVASRTDFNGIKTAYTYDLNRNLETTRTEAVGTPGARTITTEWHPTYRLASRIAEPKLRTSLTFDVSGNVLTRRLQSTTDVDGSLGFNATVSGASRTWTLTYNAVGQTVTVTGPRSDVLEKTVYAYDNVGNLATLTNAAGQITTFDSYDANGRLTQMTAPNGTSTAITYSPRGWLLKSVITPPGATASQETLFTYDGIGQVKTVTLPDTSVMSYNYDDAHRLIQITDSLNNVISYTLDSMGNRTAETVTDPAGSLARATTRVYDALNRMQQVTGGAQ